MCTFLKPVFFGIKLQVRAVITYAYVRFTFPIFLKFCNWCVTHYTFSYFSGNLTFAHASAVRDSNMDDEITYIYIYICIYIHGMKTNPTKPPKPTKPIPIHFFIFPHTYNIFVFTYFQMFWPTMYAMSRLTRLWHALARSQRSQSRMQVSCLRWWGHRSCLIAVWSRFSKSSTKRWSTICNS